MCSPLPGEASFSNDKYGIGNKSLPLPLNLPTHLPHEQDDLLPSASPPLLDDDPNYIPPYSPEAIPPQSPIPARDDAEETGDVDNYVPSPQTPPVDSSPSSTPPPVDDDAGGDYSPSAPHFTGKKKRKSLHPSDVYKPSARKENNKLSRSCLKKFAVLGASSDVPIWRGTLGMADVAKFSATAFEVSGGSINFTQDVPETVDVVGRIAPENVWTYIADTKKAANKEILVVRFQPTSEEEKSSYINLYSYLSGKKR